MHLSLGLNCLPGTCTWLPDSLTWYYNHETEKFTSGPHLLEGRTEHASATIVDKGEGKENIPIVAGGHGYGANGDQWLESTEMLIDGQWQPGKGTKY